MNPYKSLVAAAIALSSSAASAQYVTGSTGSLGNGSSFLSLTNANVTGGAIYAQSDSFNWAARPTNSSPVINTVGNWVAVGGSNNSNNGGGTTASLKLAPGTTSLGFLWGTPDSFNSVTIKTNAGNQVFTASQLGLTQSTNASFAGYVNFKVTGAATSITGVDFVSTQQAFEIGNVSAVPEPGTYAMLLSGLAAVGFVARRRRAGSSATAGSDPRPA